MSALLPPSKHLKPNTFGQRGVLAPFTGGPLTHARVRRGNPELELLIDGFSGADGVYVIPASQLGGLLPLNLHDQALLAMITRNRMIDPATVRGAALKVAKAGLGGPDRKAQAETRLQQDRVGQLAQFHRILSALSAQAGLPDLGPDPAAVDPRSQPGRQLAEEVFGAAALALDLDRETLKRRVQAMVPVLSPVAADDKGQAGWLHRSYQRLQAFAAGLSSAGDVTVHNQPLLDTVSRTLSRAAQIVTSLEKAQGDLLALVTSWDAEGEKAIRQQVMRLAWMMDGWDAICDSWEGATDADRNQKFEILETIARMAPVLPRSEDDTAPVAETHRLGMQGRRMVRANQDWRTGAADEELLQRLKTVAAASEPPPREAEPDSSGEFLL